MRCLHQAVSILRYHSPVSYTHLDIQKRTLEQSCELIRQLVEERQRQGMTQQEVADITGILPSNLARLESGKRVPTLVVLQKYASALGKHIELKLCDGAEE